MAGLAQNIIREITELLAKFAEYNGLQLTIEGVTKGAMITSGCALAGGLLGGPVGLGVGGVAGSVSAAYTGKGTYQSAANVIRSLTPSQQSSLISTLVTSLKVIAENLFEFLGKALLQGKLLSVIMEGIKRYFVGAGYLTV